MVLGGIRQNRLRPQRIDTQINLKAIAVLFEDKLPYNKHKSFLSLITFYSDMIQKIISDSNESIVFPEEAKEDHSSVDHQIQVKERQETWYREQ